MRTRVETVVSIDRAWATSDENHRILDVILPEGTTDWFVTVYDGSESLWYVKDGKLYNENHRRIDHEGRKKEDE